MELARGMMFTCRVSDMGSGGVVAKSYPADAPARDCARLFEISWRICRSAGPKATAICKNKHENREPTYFSDVQLSTIFTPPMESELRGAGTLARGKDPRPMALTKHRVSIEIWFLIVGARGSNAPACCAR